MPFEWKAQLLDGKHPPRHDWTRGYLVPVAERKQIEAWQKQRLLADD